MRSTKSVLKDVIRPSVGIRQVAAIMLYYTTQLISHMDLIKYIFEKLAFTRKISHSPMRMSWH